MADPPSGAQGKENARKSPATICVSHECKDTTKCEPKMSTTTALLVLFLAALLEAGGDALMRAALHTTSLWPRVALFALAGGLLCAYGWTVNAPPWDFGRLLGLYVVFFFVIAQTISWLGFKQLPTVPILFGGVLIVSGGLVIALAKS